MKKHAYFSLIFLIILSMGYFSCSEDPLYQNEHFFQNLPEKSKFTVSEARAFFEAQQKQLPTRSALHKRSGRFDPGIFAPRWEEAKESANRQEGSVDVPIYSSWRYQAGRKEIRKGKKRTYWVTVSQKLVVVKDWNTNKNAMYILNIIPDKNYSKKNKGDISGKFTNSGSRKDFCGLFVYTDLKGGLPVCVTRYKSGEPIDGVYLFNKNHGLKPTLEKLNAMLKGIRLRYGAPLTRANSEDDDDYWNDEDDEDNEGNKEEGDDDWLFPDGDSYTDEDGNTCWDFEDKNGNQYTAVDWDGDGMPDSIMGDTSSITPDSGGDFDFGGWLNDFWGGFDPGNNDNNEDDNDDDIPLNPGIINPGTGGGGDIPLRPDPDVIPNPCAGLLFNGIMEKLLRHEGGFVNNPNDKGKATNKGISWKTWEANAKSILNIEPTLDNLKKLTDEQASRIYEKEFWNRIKADQINDPDMRYAIFDFYVNAGGKAIKVLQETLNEIQTETTLIADGVIGSKTITCLNKANRIIAYNKFLENRKKYYNKLVEEDSTQKVFLKGWLNRTNSFKQKSTAQKYNVNC